MRADLEHERQTWTIPTDRGGPPRRAVARRARSARGRRWSPPPIWRRAAEPGGALDWVVAVVLGALAVAYLAALLDARTPLLVADDRRAPAARAHLVGLPWGGSHGWSTARSAAGGGRAAGRADRHYVQRVIEDLDRLPVVRRGSTGGYRPARRAAGSRDAGPSRRGRPDAALADSPPARPWSTGRGRPRGRAGRVEPARTSTTRSRSRPPSASPTCWPHTASSARSPSRRRAWSATRARRSRSLIGRVAARFDRPTAMTRSRRRPSSRRSSRARPRPVRETAERPARGPAPEPRRGRDAFEADTQLWGAAATSPRPTVAPLPIDAYGAQPAARPGHRAPVRRGPSPARADRRRARRAHPDPSPCHRGDRGRRLQRLRRRLLRPRAPAHPGPSAGRRRGAAAGDLRRSLRRRPDRPAPGLRGRAGHRRRVRSAPPAADPTGRCSSPP